MSACGLFSEFSSSSQLSDVSLRDICWVGVSVRNSYTLWKVPQHTLCWPSARGAFRWTVFETAERRVTGAMTGKRDAL